MSSVHPQQVIRRPSRMRGPLRDPLFLQVATCVGFRSHGGIPGNNLFRLCLEGPALPPLPPLSTAPSQRGQFSSSPARRSLALEHRRPIAFVIPDASSPHLPVLPSPYAGPQLISRASPALFRSGRRLHDDWAQRSQKRSDDGLR